MNRKLWNGLPQDRVLNIQNLFTEFYGNIENEKVEQLVTTVDLNKMNNRENIVLY